MLPSKVVIRGEAPTGRPQATDGKLDLPTKFIFNFRDAPAARSRPTGTSSACNPTTAITSTPATTSASPGSTWSGDGGLRAGGELGQDLGLGRRHAERQAQGGLGQADPIGSHPIDALAGVGKRYTGLAHSRFVFGCVLEDSALLDDFSDPGYGPDGFSTSRSFARSPFTAPAS